MALTYAPAGELGAPCPPFSLPSVEGRQFQLQDFSSFEALAVAFICNHCPYVQAIEDRFLSLARQHGKRVQFIGICSNDSADHPEDSPEALKQRWLEKKYGFPYLIDADQNVARAFGAVCTPDFFVYDSARKLAYRGRLDDAWKNPSLARRSELKEAIEAILAGHAIRSRQNPSMGCSIKWKKGG